MSELAIICVDDEKTVLSSLRNQLRRGLDGNYAIELAESGEEALEILAEFEERQVEVPVIISDQIMPGMKGDELLIEVHRVYPQTLKILLTGQASLGAVGNAVNLANLYRYIAKPWDETDLNLTVREALRSYLYQRELSEKNRQLEQLNTSLELKVRERTAELQRANQELSRLANLDGLTQIANRRRFDDYLAFEWLRHARDRLPLSLILIDIDYFKRYNDFYGHQGGDDCLSRVASTISLVLMRPSDLVARYGGEEFAVILPNTTTDGGVVVAESIRTAIAALAIPHVRSDVSPYVTLSLGVAGLIPTPTTRPQDLIAVADKALYQSKHLGRDRTSY